MQEGRDIWAPLLAFQLARALAQKEEYEEAERVVRGSLAEDRPDLIEYGHSDWILPLLRNELGAALAGQGRFQEAEPLVLDSQEQLAAARSVDWDAVRRIENIILLYDRWEEAEPRQGHAATADEWRAKLPAEDAPN